MNLENLMQNFPQWVIFLICVFTVTVIIMWVLLPFAVFGIKRRLDSQTIILEEIFKQAGGRVIARHGIKDYQTARGRKQEDEITN